MDNYRNEKWLVAVVRILEGRPAHRYDAEVERFAAAVDDLDQDPGAQARIPRAIPCALIEAMDDDEAPAHVRQWLRDHDAEQLAGLAAEAADRGHLDGPAVKGWLYHLVAEQLNWLLYEGIQNVRYARFV